MTSFSDITKSEGISSVIENILGGPGPFSGYSGSEHNDNVSEKYGFIKRGGRRCFPRIWMEVIVYVCYSF